jgi:enoyl-CoA hydratase/carnithine racemase
MEFDGIELTRCTEGVLVAKLNRPERLNALGATQFRELATFGSAARKDPDLRVLILTGAGAAFSVGYESEEVDEFATLSTLDIVDRQDRAAQAIVAIRSLHTPVIAAVNGLAAGVGFSLALAACIRLAARSASFTAESAQFALSPGDLGASWLLPRIVGPAVAADMCYTGRPVEAAEAERIGLVNEVVEDDNLLDRSLELAELIGRNSPAAVQMSKRVLQANLEVSSYAAALEMENRGQALLTRGADMKEALAAYVAKRAPVFTGR